MRTLLCLALLVGCRPSEQQCTALLDHFLEVEGATATDPGRFVQMTAGMNAALEASKREHRAAIHDRFVAGCQRTLPRAEVECALSAPTEAAMDACEGRP